MKTRSSVRSIAPVFNKKDSFTNWMRNKLLEVQQQRREVIQALGKACPVYIENNISAIEMFECVLKNFHLFRNGRIYNYDHEDSHNKFLFTAFKRIVYLRREQIGEEFFEDVDSIIEAFIQKNTCFLDSYAESINTEEEEIKLCKYYKKYSNKLSFSTALKMEDFMRHNFNKDFSKCIRVYSSLGENTPEYIIEKIDRWWAATKIKRWFRAIIHQPSVYQVAERIVWRSIEDAGLKDIFAES